MDEWPPPPLAPLTPLREEQWRMLGITGKPVICTVEQAPVGYEVRVGYSADDILHTHLCRTLEHARDYATVSREFLATSLGLTDMEGTM